MSNVAIIVVAGGHIFVGVVDKDPEKYTLAPCRQFTRLGSTDLVAGLVDGPKLQTTMMAVMPSIEIPLGQVRFIAQASEAAWAPHLGVRP
jgi:hypothetical protein